MPRQENIEKIVGYLAEHKGKRIRNNKVYRMKTGLTIGQFQDAVKSLVKQGILIKIKLNKHSCEYRIKSQPGQVIISYA